MWTTFLVFRGLARRCCPAGGCLLGPPPLPLFFPRPRESCLTAGIDHDFANLARWTIDLRRLGGVRAVICCDACASRGRRGPSSQRCVSHYSPSSRAHVSGHMFTCFLIITIHPSCRTRRDLKSPNPPQVVLVAKPKEKKCVKIARNCQRITRSSGLAWRRREGKQDYLRKVHSVASPTLMRTDVRLPGDYGREVIFLGMAVTVDRERGKKTRGRRDARFATVVWLEIGFSRWTSWDI